MILSLTKRRPFSCAPEISVGINKEQHRHSRFLQTGGICSTHYSTQVKGWIDDGDDPVAISAVRSTVVELAGPAASLFGSLLFHWTIDPNHLGFVSLLAHAFLIVLTVGGVGILGLEDLPRSHRFARRTTAGVTPVYARPTNSRCFSTRARCSSKYTSEPIAVDRYGNPFTGNGL